MLACVPDGLPVEEDIALWVRLGHGNSHALDTLPLVFNDGSSAGVLTVHDDTPAMPYQIFCQLICKGRKAAMRGRHTAGAENSQCTIQPLFFYSVAAPPNLTPFPQQLLLQP